MGETHFWGVFEQSSWKFVHILFQGYERKLRFSNHISWRVFEQSRWKCVHILFQGYERSWSIAFSKNFRKFPTIFISENTVFLPKMSVFETFFFWILIKRINSNLQEMVKNYIWIFTLEIFQNVPGLQNSESSHRRCISLKTILGQWNFSGETFSI